jgi:hypothetical protein
MSPGAAPAEGEPRGPGARCDHCGRTVRETMHERSTYVVDAFVLHTGDTEPAVVRRADSDAVAFTYRRLIRPVAIVTCADCYADPAVRSRHETWRHPLDAPAE